MVYTYGKVRTSFPIDTGANHLNWKLSNHTYPIAERHKKITDCMYNLSFLMLKPYVTNDSLVYVLLSKK